MVFGYVHLLEMQETIQELGDLGIPVGAGVWGKAKQDDTTTTVQGGTQGVANFMEIEGVIRQTDVEREEIRVKSPENRELLLRDRDAEIMGQRKGIVSATNEDMANENVVTDPKRKRIDENMLGGDHGIDNVEKMGNQQQVGPKNLIMAGPGV